MNTSKQAYFKPENIKARQTHKQIVLSALAYEKNGLTSREIAYKAGLKHQQVWKRCSDLLNEKKIVVAGEKLEENNHVSIFKLNREPELFERPKKMNLKTWLEKTYPFTMCEYYDYLRE